MLKRFDEPLPDAGAAPVAVAVAVIDRLAASGLAAMTGRRSFGRVIDSSHPVGVTAKVEHHGALTRHIAKRIAREPDAALLNTVVLNRRCCVSAPTPVSTRCRSGRRRPRIGLEDRARRRVTRLMLRFDTLVLNTSRRGLRLTPLARSPNRLVNSERWVDT